ncbi:MAG: ArnT family glycosyltransferase [Anaerolineae bacterium]
MSQPAPASAARPGPLARWAPLVLVALAAAAFRYPLLDSLPPGLNFDEGGEGIAALDVAHGIFRVWWPIGGGKEPLMAYLVQPFFWLFGQTRLALRAYTATLGVGSALATFWLARELGPGLGRDRQGLPSLLLPTLAGLGLATAFWHVAYSRIAFRALSNPLVEALALAFLWRGLRTGRWRDFILSGVFAGGLFYTYLAGRFVPPALVLFFAAQALLAWRQDERSLLLRFWKQLAVLGGTAVLAAGPLLLFFLRNPAAFFERAGAVSIFNPAMNGGDFWGTLWRSTAGTVGTFLSLSGDPNCLGNIPVRAGDPACSGAIPGSPMLGPALAAAFVLGFAVCLWRWRDPAHLFLLVWWPVMLLPAILAPEGVPHHLRLIGTAPATYILVAIGLWTFLAASGQIINRVIRYQILGIRGQPLFAFALGLLIFVAIGFQTYRDYFVRWPVEVDSYLPFDVYAGELAGQIAAESDPAVAYVIPMDLRAAHEARHYSLDFLYRGATRWGYVPVDEATVAERLTELAAGKSALKVVRWTADKHREADAKELVTFLLGLEGKLVNVETYRAYNIETYQLPGPNTVFAFPQPKPRGELDFAGLLRLEAWRLGLAPAGDRLWVALQLSPLAPMDADYKASVRLVAPDGSRPAQQDRLLLHNWHQGTRLWPAEPVREYYLLPLPPEAPSGAYEVRLVLYHPDTLAPLTVEGRQEVLLGSVQVE